MADRFAYRDNRQHPPMRQDNLHLHETSDQRRRRNLMYYGIAAGGAALGAATGTDPITGAGLAITGAATVELGQRIIDEYRTQEGQRQAAGRQRLIQEDRES